MTYLYISNITTWRDENIINDYKMIIFTCCFFPKSFPWTIRRLPSTAASLSRHVFKFQYDGFIQPILCSSISWAQMVPFQWRAMIFFNSNGFFVWRFNCRRLRAHRVPRAFGLGRLQRLVGGGRPTPCLSTALLEGPNLQGLPGDMRVQCRSNKHLQ